MTDWNCYALAVGVRALYRHGAQLNSTTTSQYSYSCVCDSNKIAWPPLYLAQLPRIVGRLETSTRELTIAIKYHGTFQMRSLSLSLECKCERRLPTTSSGEAASDDEGGLLKKIYVIICWIDSFSLLPPFGAHASSSLHRASLLKVFTSSQFIQNYMLWTQTSTATHALNSATLDRIVLLFVSQWFHFVYLFIAGIGHMYPSRLVAARSKMWVADEIL